MNAPKRDPSILRLLLRIEESSAPYNQFSMSVANRQDITLCTYFKSRIEPADGIRLYEGDGTLRGFFRQFRRALSEREYDIVHVHSPHLGAFVALAGLVTRRRLLPKTVYTVHNSYPSFRWRNRLFMIPVFALHKRVVCCGEASLQSLPLFFKWLTASRLRAISNGVDLDRVDRAQAGKADGPRNQELSVVSVARLIEIKNPLLLLRAFQESGSPGANLAFVGDGPLRDGLLHEAENLRLQERVRITGLIPRDRVYGELKLADLFVSASRVEGIPVAVLEAMASRCPVVLSDIPSHREIADGAPFIPLVDPDDVSGFAEQIARFRRMEPAERKGIGGECRRLVESRFSLVTMLRNYEKVYRELFSAPG